MLLTQTIWRIIFVFGLVLLSLKQHLYHFFCYISLRELGLCDMDKKKKYALITILKHYSHKCIQLEFEVYFQKKTN